MGAIGPGDFVSPVFIPGERPAIVAIGRAARWVWGVDRAEAVDGKGKQTKRSVGVGILVAFLDCWRGYVKD